MSRLLEAALVILNPAAGRGAARRAWAAAEKALRAEGADLAVVATQGPGDAVNLARTAVREGRRAVIAIGGDGTIQEVANGLMQAVEDGEPSIPLGIIPGGSGNDFIKPLRIPNEPGVAARILLKGETRSVDVGRVGNRFFVNGVGVGLDACVAMKAAEIRFLRGTPLYATALLRVLKDYNAPHVRIFLDDVEVADRPAALVTIANGPCCGGGFWLCPDARLDDGKLDVLIADASSRRRVLKFLVRSLSGKHVGGDGIHHYRASTVRLVSPSTLPVHLDGEIPRPRPMAIDVSVAAGRLRVIAPPAN